MAWVPRGRTATSNDRQVRPSRCRTPRAADADTLSPMHMPRFTTGRHSGPAQCQGVSVPTPSIVKQRLRVAWAGTPSSPSPSQTHLALNSVPPPRWWASPLTSLRLSCFFREVGGSIVWRPLAVLFGAFPETCLSLSLCSVSGTASLTW